MFLAAAVIFLASTVLARPYHPDREEGRSMSAWTGWGPGMAMFSSSFGDEDPWASQPPVWRMDEDGPRPLDSPTRKDSKKKHHSRDRDQDEEDDDSGERGGSRANASFNAWFPILLGGYPGAEEASGRGWRQQQPEREGLAAVANSVNHGRSGVANSHAVVFTGDPLDLVQSNRRRTPAQASYRHR